MSRNARWWKRRRSAAGLVLGLVALAALAGGTLLAAVAAAQDGASVMPSSPAGAEPQAASSPSAGPSPILEVSCALSLDSVVYGTAVTASGTITPAGDGQAVTIVLAGTDVATVASDATGDYSATFTPTRGGEVVARLPDGTASASSALEVKPKVTITHGTAYPFLNLKYTIKVEPSTYDGTVTAALWHNGATLWRGKKNVSAGKAVISLPMRGVGWFAVRSSFSAVEGLAARTAETRAKAAAKTLAVGSKGAHVRGLLTALNRLKIRVPYIGYTLNRDCADAVVAFQKAYRLPRTYVFNADDWKRLDTARVAKPRYAYPYDHLEVDKTRQILMMVRGGSLRGLIAISSGATGKNTPEGSFRILQKSPYTGSAYGGTLFRTMGFYGNYAIHGYIPVPPYPASHGCVREPMWAADWVYDRTVLGERLYIYR